MGELVRVSGVIDEYYGVTEIDVSDSVDNFNITRLGYDYDMITPIAVDSGTIGTSCNFAGEAYEGVLVTLSDVEIMGEENSYGEIEIDDGSGATQLEDDLMDTAEHFADSFCSDNYVGEVIPTLVGVVDYSWSSYEIHPRTIDDITLTADCPSNVTAISSIQTVTDVSGSICGDSPYHGHLVTV